MKIMKFVLITLIILILTGCEQTHHSGEDNCEGHDHEVTEKQPIRNADSHESQHNDAFGGLDLDMEEEHPVDEIIFSEEQQQLVDFAVVSASQRKMRSSLQATGVINASSYGATIVTAPVSGYLATLDAPFPRFGDKVNAGDIIVEIIPSLNSDSDHATLDLEVRRARSGYQLAVKELTRVEILFEQGIVPEKRVQEARKEEQVAKAELTSAEQRFKLFQNHPGKNNGDSSLKVNSPIGGTLDGVYVTPGAYLQEGDVLFHVVNTDILRLEAKIPEADVAQLINPQGAWFTVDGFDSPFHIDLAKGDRLIAVGSVIDPKTRTIPLVFEFTNTNNALRVGMFARVNVVIGEARESIAIPVSAVQEHIGLAVVYVQLHSDAFERRVVSLGIRDGDFIEIKKGLIANDKVVTRGAYLIQLAASGPQVAGHGHAH